MAVKVDESKCTGCGACVDTCPSSVFEIVKGKSKVVRESDCIFCHACEAACPEGAIKVTDE